MRTSSFAIRPETGEPQSDPDGARASVAGVDAARASALMERYADGDDAVFGELFDLLAPRLQSFARRYPHVGGAADDVVQQTLLQLHLNRCHFVRGAPVLPWAYAIARNLIRGLHRRASRGGLAADLELLAARAPEFASAPSAPDELLETRRRERALVAALQRIPEHLRDALVLVKLEELPIEEAAQVLGISQSNVKVRAHRGQALLRQALARPGAR